MRVMYVTSGGPVDPPDPIELAKRYWPDMLYKEPKDPDRLKHETSTRRTAIVEEVYKRYHAHGGELPWERLGVAEQVAWEAAIGAMLDALELPYLEQTLLTRLRTLPVGG